MRAPQNFQIWVRDGDTAMRQLTAPIRRISDVKRHAVQITTRDRENGGSSPPAEYGVPEGAGLRKLGSRRIASFGES